MAPERYYFPSISKSQPGNGEITQPSVPEKMQTGLIKDGVAKRIKLESLYRKSGEPDEKELAYSKGLAEGKHLGIAQEKKRVDTVIDLLNGAIDQINHQKDDLKDKMEEMASSLAVAIARKIIGKEIHFDNKIVLNTVERAIAKFSGEDHISIVVHPEDKGIIETSIVEMNKEKQLSVTADSSVAKGGCIVSTEFKTFDANIESQLKVVENAFEAIRLNPENE